jgi:hypothetical protein
MYIDDVERSSCTGINYHSMQRALTSLGYLPVLSSAKGVQDSAVEVARRLSNIQVLRYVRDTDPELHAACNAGRQLAAAVRAILDSVEDPVDVETMARLRIHERELSTSDNGVGFSGGGPIE